MSNQLVLDDQQKRIERQAVKSTLAWSGFGSPIGLGVLLVSVGIFLVCLHLAGLVG